MHGVWREPVPQSKIRSPGNRTKKTEPLPLAFKDLARFAFPIKTLESLGAELARVGKPRARSTIAAWLSGQHDAPADVAWLVLQELMRRMSSR